MHQLLSPKQVAQAIGASESSLKRWCDSGLLKTVKTAGGHRRISVQEALRFAREQNHTVIEPQLLAIPASEDRKARRIEGCAERLTEALLSDNEDAARTIVFDLFLAGHPLSVIFDEVMAVAFHAIGQRWECHRAEIYEERGSCLIAMRLLHELRARLVPPEQTIRALGATTAGDHYTIPVTMVELVLRSVGWDARQLGPSIPFESMIHALRQNTPRVFWMSVSFIPDEAAFIRGFQALSTAASQTNTAVVVGGQALTAEIRAQLRYATFCDTMRQLEEFARTVYRPEPAAKTRRHYRKKSESR